MSKLKKGNDVSWNTPQGKTSGTVKQKLTSDTKLGGKTYKASVDDPKYKVESNKSGKEAIHKEDSINKE